MAKKPTKIPIKNPKKKSIKKSTKKTIHNQPSWRLANDCVEAYVTETGGHLGPVTFDRGGRNIQPYHVAPWAEEKVDAETPSILKVLRGDFFCMPFGANEQAYRGEQHPPHGESANAKWRLKSLDRSEGESRLHLSLRTKVRAGHVDKIIRLVDGHNALYCQHVISEMSGTMSFGHHATLHFPDEPGSGHISTSRFVRGQTYTEPMETPDGRGYSILKPDAHFRSLDRVPTVMGEQTDLSNYPARRGYEDAVQLISDPKSDLAWTAVAFPKQRYVWFALKDPRVLTSTLFWFSNGGRHYAPWNGRHINVMGLEEITSYFYIGLNESAKKNPLSEKGFRTAVRLNPKRPLVVNYIMAVAPIPRGFDRVKKIVAQDQTVSLTAHGGAKINVPLDTHFLRHTGTDL